MREVERAADRQTDRQTDWDETKQTSMQTGRHKDILDVICKLAVQNC